MYSKNGLLLGSDYLTTNNKNIIETDNWGRPQNEINGASDAEDIHIIDI